MVIDEMKKSAIQLGIVLALLAGAVAAWLLLRPATEEDEASGASQAPALQVFSSDSPMKEAVVEYGGERYTLQSLAANAIEAQSNPAYTVKELSAHRLKDELVSAACQGLAALPAKKLVEEKAPDLEKYGLAAPALRVRATYMDGSALTLLAGSDAPTGEGVYACVEGGGDVYLVDRAAIDPYRHTLYDYLSTIVTGGDYSSELQAVLLSGPRWKEPVVIEAGGQGSGSAQEYRIVSPVSAPVDRSASSALHSLLGLSAREVVKVDADIGDRNLYGISTPDATIDVRYDDKTFTLSVSQPTPEGNVYLMVSGETVIYAAPERSLPVLGMEYYDLIAKTVASPATAELYEVAVEAGGVSRTFTLRTENDLLTVTSGGKQLDTESFNKFYGSLTKVQYAEHIGDTAPEPAEDPVLRITYRYRSGSTDTVSFYPGPPRRYLVQHGELLEFYTASTYVDNILDALKTLE